MTVNGGVGGVHSGPETIAAAPSFHDAVRAAMASRPKAQSDTTTYHMACAMYESHLSQARAAAATTKAAAEAGAQPEHSRDRSQFKTSTARDGKVAEVDGGKCVQLVYPPEQGATHTIEILTTDFSRLAPGEFLNDNLVDFFLKVIHSHCSELVRRRNGDRVPVELNLNLSASIQTLGSPPAAR